MRIVLLVAGFAILSACSSGDGDRSVAVVCAEQSALAQNGTTDGGRITITCPN
jgi:hypothetical protein